MQQGTDLSGPHATWSRGARLPAPARAWHLLFPAWVQPAAPTTKTPVDLGKAPDLWMLSPSGGGGHRQPSRAHSAAPPADSLATIPRGTHLVPEHEGGRRAGQPAARWAPWAAFTPGRICGSSGQRTSGQTDSRGETEADRPGVGTVRVGCVSGPAQPWCTPATESVSSSTRSGTWDPCTGTQVSAPSHAQRAPHLLGSWTLAFPRFQHHPPPTPCAQLHICRL